MTDAIGGAVMLAGALFVLLAGIGVVRFGDIYARMHAAAKGPALGVLLVAVGVVLTIGSVKAAIAAALVVLLQFIAGPVGTHMLGRSVYRRLRPPLAGVDELAEAELAEAERAEAERAEAERTEAGRDETGRDDLRPG